MNQLMNDLFGEDSDTESEGNAAVDNMGDDPLFDAIMSATADDSGDQFSLLDTTIPYTHETFQAVPGLSLHHNVLTHEDQSRLLQFITDANYFKGGDLNQSMCFGETNLRWLRWETVFDRMLTSHGMFEDGIIVISLMSPTTMDFYPAKNPMSPSGSAHGTGVDQVRCATENDAAPSLSLRLDPGSVLVLEGEARWAWEHGIREHLHDNVDGELVPRRVRVSVTLRRVRDAGWQVGDQGTARESGVRSVVVGP
ncbi:hypothetical protein DFQ27_007613 [Actinomortierella ambigua]|uniref:Alpha-ketoglutarate-dependent dioxygenase AlkB-like domain-containing protein n=1 Tax=Actinomortierella ambigua TaxID=1343610 RepID=A0A9P6PW30_9FUNG|nr:hypothetical protein DFQ27_007613 [Actinomortierella ambigua]